MIKSRIAVSVLALTLASGLTLGAVPARAQIFGPSDEEKEHEASQDRQIDQLTGDSQQLSGRIQALEDKVHSLTDSLSRATGGNEELRHEIDVLQSHIDQQQKDFAYRLCMLSAQQLGAGSDQGGLNCTGGGNGGGNGGGGMAPPPPQQQSFGDSGGGPGAPRALQPGNSLPPIGNGGGDDSGASPVGPSDGGGGNSMIRGRPPGTLGTLSGGNMGSGAPSLNPPLRNTSGGGGAQFDTAMNLLSKAQYSEASVAFRAYADSHPGDTDLSPQAIYWIGDIGYVQQDYQGAARSFAELIKKYPKSSRAPDAMLKLGQSFAALGQKNDACTTFGLLKSKFPDASAGTLTAAAAARKAASCAR